MRTRILERNWRQACGRVAHAWSKNRWITAHRLRPQMPDTRWSTAADNALRAPVQSDDAAGMGPQRRYRAAEGIWENEGGAVRRPLRAPALNRLEE